MPNGCANYFIRLNMHTCWCTACLFEKAKKKSIEPSVTSDLAEVEGVLTNKDAQPGDKVS